MKSLVLIVTDNKDDQKVVPREYRFHLASNIEAAKDYLKTNPQPTQLFINAKLTTEKEFNDLQKTGMQYGFTRVAAYRSWTQLDAQLQMCPFVPPY